MLRQEKSIKQVLNQKGKGHVTERRHFETYRHKGEKQVYCKQIDNRSLGMPINYIKVLINTLSDECLCGNKVLIMKIPAQVKIKNNTPLWCISFMRSYSRRSRGMFNGE